MDSMFPLHKVASGGMAGVSAQHPEPEWVLSPMQMSAKQGASKAAAEEFHISPSVFDTKNDPHSPELNTNP